MLASLRRVYYYLITSGALIFSIAVLQNLIHEVLLRVGFFNYVYNGGLGHIYDPVNLTRALTFLLVDLIVVVPVGGLHWALMRRDMRQEPATRIGSVRAFFLGALVAGTGLVVIFGLASTVIALDSGAEAARATAIPLSFASAWAIALGLLLLEWRSTGAFKEEGRILATVFALIGQWILIIASVVYIAEAIQSYLQTLLNPLPLCINNFNFDGGARCINGNGPIGTTLAALVTIGGLVLYMLWTRRGTSDVLRTVNTIIAVVIGAITSTIFLVIMARYFVDLATGVAGVRFPQSLINYAPDSVVSSIWVGPLLAGFAVLAYYLSDQWRRPLPEGAIGRQSAIATLAVPLAFVFFIGASLVIGEVLLTLGGRVIAPNEWNNAWMFFFGGLPWLGLWPALATMSDPSGEGPHVPRRVYVYILLAGSLGAAVISLATALYTFLSGVMGFAVDPTGDTTLRAFGFALATGAGAGYYIYVLMRDIRRQRQRVATNPPPVVASAAPSPLEALLIQVAQGQLPVDQAAAILRQHPELR